MAGVNIDSVGLTYINYLDGVDESLNNLSKARSMFKKNNDWTGAQLEWRVHVRRSGALQAMDDGGALPSASQQTYTAAKVGRKMVAGTIQLTDGVMATASKSKFVAKDVIESEMEGLMNEFLNYENFFMYRNGDGVCGTVQTGTTGTTLLVDDARGLWEGVTYDVYDSTLATNRGTITVSADASAFTTAGFATVTTTSTVPSGTIAGDKIVWKNSVSKVISGLQKLITDSGTLQNISAATYPRHTSFVFGNSGTARDFSPTLFRQLQAVLFQKAGKSDSTSGLTIIGSAGQMVSMDELYESELRVTPDSDTGGMAMPSFQSSFGKFKVLAEKDAPYGKLWFVDFDQLYRGTQKKLAWRTEKNGSIFKQSQTSLSYSATALEICELYIRERTSSAVITDLTTTNDKTAF